VAGLRAAAEDTKSINTAKLFFYKYGLPNLISIRTFDGGSSSLLGSNYYPVFSFLIMLFTMVKRRRIVLAMTEIQQTWTAIRFCIVNMVG
jgi:hypothetical protein